MNQQLPLPALDFRQVCPFCLRPAAFLGQYSPLWPWGVCRECSLVEPYPIEVFKVSAKTRDESGLRIDPSASWELKNRRVMLDNLLRAAVKGLPEEPPVKFNITLRALRNPIRYSRANQYERWHRDARLHVTYRQLILLFCRRCGCGHDRKEREYCERCEGLMQAESLWRYRSILACGDDLEAQLDKVYKTFPNLFELGILPDRWFELAEKETFSDPSVVR